MEEEIPCGRVVVTVTGRVSGNREYLDRSGELGNGGTARLLTETAEILIRYGHRHRIPGEQGDRDLPGIQRQCGAADPCLGENHGNRLFHRSIYPSDRAYLRDLAHPLSQQGPGKRSRNGSCGIVTNTTKHDFWRCDGRIIRQRTCRHRVCIFRRGHRPSSHGIPTASTSRTCDRTRPIPQNVRKFLLGAIHT